MFTKFIRNKFTNFCSKSRDLQKIEFAEDLNNLKKYSFFYKEDIAPDTLTIYWLQRRKEQFFQNNDVRMEWYARKKKMWWKLGEFYLVWDGERQSILCFRRRKILVTKNEHDFHIDNKHKKCHEIFHLYQWIKLLKIVTHSSSVFMNILQNHLDFYVENQLRASCIVWVDQVGQCPSWKFFCVCVWRGSNLDNVQACPLENFCSQGRNSRQCPTWTLSNSDIVWVSPRPPPTENFNFDNFQLGYSPLSNLDIVQVTKRNYQLGQFSAESIFNLGIVQVNSPTPTKLTYLKELSIVEQFWRQTWKGLDQESYFWGTFLVVWEMKISQKWSVVERSQRQIWKELDLKTHISGTFLLVWKMLLSRKTES